MMELQPDIFGLAEVNIQLSQAQQLEYSTILKKSWIHSKSTYSNCKNTVPRNSPCLQGGLLQSTKANMQEESAIIIRPS